MGLWIRKARWMMRMGHSRPRLYRFEREEARRNDAMASEDGYVGYPAIAQLTGYSIQITRSPPNPLRPRLSHAGEGNLGKGKERVSMGTKR